MAETVSHLANGTEADPPVLNTVDILLLISKSVYFVVEVTLNSFIIAVLAREQVSSQRRLDKYCMAV